MGWNYATVAKKQKNTLPALRLSIDQRRRQVALPDLQNRAGRWQLSVYRPTAVHPRQERHQEQV